MDAKVLNRVSQNLRDLKMWIDATMIPFWKMWFMSEWSKSFETDERFDVTINADAGDLEIFRIRKIVDDNSKIFWDFD